MIEYKSELHEPRMEISTDLSISIKSVSEIPDNENEFRMWLANKAVELGSGRHKEYYIRDGNYENDIEVNFTVLMRNLSISTESM